MYNPGALMNVDRFVDGQWIVPGGKGYDYGPSAAYDGGNGRNVPSVGRYPSSGPWGNYLPSSLSDGPDTPLGDLAPYVVGGLLVAVLLWNLRK